MENSEHQSVENGQKHLNSASEFCKESLDSNKTPTIVENTAPDDPTSQNMIPIPQIINVLPINESFEEQTNTTRDDQNPMNFSEFWNETIESNNSAIMNENQVTLAPSPLLRFNNIRYNKKMFGITAKIFFTHANRYFWLKVRKKLAFPLISFYCRNCKKEYYCQEVPVFHIILN